MGVRLREMPLVYDTALLCSGRAAPRIHKWEKHMQNGNELNLQCVYTRICKKPHKIARTAHIPKGKQPHIKDSIDLLFEGRLASELLCLGRPCIHVEKHLGW